MNRLKYQNRSSSHQRETVLASPLCCLRITKGMEVLVNPPDLPSMGRQAGAAWGGTIYQDPVLPTETALAEFCESLKLTLADGKREVVQRMFPTRADKKYVHLVTWSQKNMPLIGGKVLLSIDCVRLGYNLLYLQEKGIQWNARDLLRGSHGISDRYSTIDHLLVKPAKVSDVRREEIFEGIVWRWEEHISRLYEKLQGFPWQAGKPGLRKSAMEPQAGSLTAEGARALAEAKHAARAACDQKMAARKDAGLRAGRANQYILGGEWRGLPDVFRHSDLSAAGHTQLQAFLELPNSTSVPSSDLVNGHMKTIADPQGWLRGLVLDEFIANIQQRQIDMEAIQGPRLSIPCQSRCFTTDFYHILMGEMRIPIPSDPNFATEPWVSDHEVEMWEPERSPEQILQAARVPGYEYSSDRLQKYIKRQERGWGVEFFDLDRLVFPVNVDGLHWITVMVAFQMKQVFIIDPEDEFGRRHGNIFDNIIRFLNDHQQTAGRGRPRIPETPWTRGPIRPPNQTNGCACGPFAIWFASQLTCGLDLGPIKQSQMLSLRKTLASSLLTGDKIGLHLPPAAEHDAAMTGASLARDPAPGAAGKSVTLQRAPLQALYSADNNGDPLCGPGQVQAEEQAKLQQEKDAQEEADLLETHPGVPSHRHLSDPAPADEGSLVAEPLRNQHLTSDHWTGCREPATFAHARTPSIPPDLHDQMPLNPDPELLPSLVEPLIASGQDVAQGHLVSAPAQAATTLSQAIATDLTEQQTPPSHTDIVQPCTRPSLAHNQAAVPSSLQLSGLAVPEASRGHGSGDIHRHRSEEQQAASSLAMLRKGSKRGRGVHAPPVGAEDTGTMPVGRATARAEPVKRRRTQLAAPALPAANIGIAERALPQSGAEADLANQQLRPQPSSHAADRLRQAQLPLDLVDQSQQPVAEIGEITLDVETAAIKWPELLALLKEAVKLYPQRHLERNASRWEEIAQLLARVIGLDLAECRLQQRQRGALNLDLCIHKIMEDVAFARAANTMKQYWRKMMQILAWLRSTDLSEGDQGLLGLGISPACRSTVLGAQNFMEFLLAEEDRRRHVDMVEPEADDNLEIFPHEDATEQYKAMWEGNHCNPAMGIETFKQYLAAANLIQAWQQGMLYGDLTCPAITTDPNIRRDLRLRKRSENHRRAECYEDAAAGAPLITTTEQRHALVKTCLDVPEPGPFMARLRTCGMYVVAKGTAARPDEIRSKRECQALDVTYAPAEDQMVSKQPMQLMVWSKVFGKTSGGDKSEYQACGNHRDPLQDGQALLAMYDVAKSVIWKLPLCKVLEGKRAWYRDLVWLSDPADPTRPMLTTGSKVLKNAMLESKIQTGNIITHFPRHEQALESRARNIRVAAGWSRGTDTRTYAQMPTAHAIAQRADFKNQDFYMVAHLILDPTTMPEFKEMTMSLWEKLDEELVAMKEENKRRPRVDKDMAAEHYLHLKILKRRLFWQTAPFFRRHCPDARIWKETFLNEHRAVFEHWCDVQLSFCDTLKSSLEAAECGLGLPMNYSPMVSVGNQLLSNTAAMIRSADTFCDAVIAEGPEARRPGQQSHGSAQRSFLQPSSGTADATAAGVGSGLADLLNQLQPASLQGYLQGGNVQGRELSDGASRLSALESQMQQTHSMLRQLMADVYAMRTHQPALLSMMAASIKLQACQQGGSHMNTAPVQVNQQQQFHQPRSKAEAARRKRRVANEADVAKAQRAAPSHFLGGNPTAASHAAQQPQTPLTAAEGSSQLLPEAIDSAELHQLQRGPDASPVAPTADVDDLKTAMQRQLDGWEGTYQNLSAYSNAARHTSGGSLENGDDLLLLLADWELDILVGKKTNPTTLAA
ncbi:hypothetical protein WJX74_000587 [Apatococcus lobatus]|uniref:Ubiquitin-like protease family profile domain-containing protein n=1 Tax=Apatococcus lobatus TaxID=904363 RepID=A0AAW1SDH3_9CHLO